MSEPAIVVENLGKKYSLRHQDDSNDGLRHVLQRAFLRPFQSRAAKKPKPATEEFWALHDVSFSIAQGRSGRRHRPQWRGGNRRVLKIVSRITEPTRGRVRIEGRVASLLEVGTGFQPGADWTRKTSTSTAPSSA